MFRWVDHTAELELEIQAPNEASIFAEALMALGELLSTGQAGDPEERRFVSVRAEDRPALLAGWLEELVFLAESEGLEPVAAESVELSRHSVHATVIGHLGDPPPLVKAITYHRLAFTRSADGYWARVVLDV